MIMGSLVPLVFLVTIACVAVLAAAGGPGASPEHPAMAGNSDPMMPMRRDDKNAAELARFGGYGGYGGRGGKGKRRRCRDKKPERYCRWVQESGKCEKKRKKCKKTCGECQVEACFDTGFDCDRANEFICAQFWFQTGCKKSCNLCPTVITTTKPTTATTTVKVTDKTGEECEDTSAFCQNANRFRCALDWFNGGCKLSCGLCTTKEVTTTTTEPTTTKAPTTTTSPPEPETTKVVATKPGPASDCKDIGYFCQRGAEFRCNLDWFAKKCKKTCGLCETEKETTAAPTTPPEPTRGKSCKNDRDDCETFFTWFCEIPTLFLECKKFCGGCETEETTPIPPTTTTAATTTWKNCWTTGSTRMTTTTERKPTPSKSTISTISSTTEEESMTTEPKPCNDTSVMCTTWKDSGLCYDEEFKDEMEELCPASCEICTV